MTIAEYKKVLVTGGTGFIGAHIVDDLLDLGIEVRLASRSLQKAEEFINSRGARGKNIEPFEIRDFTQLENGNSFIEAVKGIDGIIHAASPLDYSVPDVEKDLIKPAIEGVRIVLEAAHQEPRVKRVVLTSSFASVMDTSRGPGPGFSYKSQDWNPLTYEESVKADPIIAYRGSKKFAEVEAWDFKNRNQSKFDLVTFCPPMTFGPVVHPVDSVENLNLSNSMLWTVYKGKEMPQSRVPVWVDVRDLALAHVRGLVVDDAANKRYLPSSPEKFSYPLAAKIMKDHGYGDKILPNVVENLAPAGYDLDYQSAENDLGIKFGGFEKCVLDSITQFLRMKKKER